VERVFSRAKLFLTDGRSVLDPELAGKIASLGSWSGELGIGKSVDAIDKITSMNSMTMFNVLKRCDIPTDVLLPCPPSDRMFPLEERFRNVMRQNVGPTWPQSNA
jgi:hypothetical protein